MTDALAIQTAPADSYVQWRDTLYMRIADSVFTDNTIEFSLQIYRPNNDWNGDYYLGDADFYFTFNRQAFDGTLVPSFVSGSVHEKLDVAVVGRRNLLFLDKAYHADRLLFSTRTDHAGGEKLEIPLKEWVTLFRVKLPMNDPDRNPEIFWDPVATGVVTAGGDVVNLKLLGDLEKNPKGTVKGGNIVVDPVMACEGSDVLLYVEDCVTSGTALKFTWSDSTRNQRTLIGEFDAPATGTSSRNYSYEVRGIGDTLVIKNASGILDSMFFSCVLTDASVGGKFVPGDARVFLRDSVFGYLASTTPDVGFGMSAAIDTIRKCPDLPAEVKFYFFGPSEDEIYNPDEISMLTVHYKRQDDDLNTYDGSFQVDMSALTSRGDFVHYASELPAGNRVNTFLYEYALKLEEVGKYWIESIETDACSNGAPFGVYDTIYVREVEGDIAYNLSAVSVGVGETIALDTARVNKPYSIELKNPTLALGTIQNRNRIYSYIAKNVAGKDTVVYKYDKEGCHMTADRMVEVVEKYYLNIKVLLEGPYLGLDDKGQDTMRCKYADQERFGVLCFPRNNLQKLVSPYDEKCILGNNEFITDISTSGTVCDWIYIKLREAEGDMPILNYVDSISALVLNDGSVCGIDGSMLNFKNLGGKKLFIEVYHRNHLGIMTLKPIELPTTIPAKNDLTIDFTDKNSVWEGNKVLILKKGKYLMIAGNINQDNVIGTGDVSVFTRNNGKTQYYYDIDQDLVVGTLDKNLIMRNNGKYALIP